ncbi:MAG TPA: phage portal protein [Agriterribacter sp.]|uniref:phage portal protein n=1 Tax=Agriterribacter sp. TaxID=2821509 RepID=UPI002BD65D92|nr:phage portal protein [Agriterribacter sp.]HRQ17710.1 phage portal protein [Agriterribacter sp.]
MTVEQLKLLVGTPDKLKEALDKEIIVRDKETYAKQYDVTGHDVSDKITRQDKTVTLNDGSTKLITVTRISVPLQKKIASTAAAFLCANPIKLQPEGKVASQENFTQLIERVWDKNKLDYKNLRIANILFSETECAELWYTEPIKEGSDYWLGTSNETVKFTLRLRIMAYSLGDTLYPVFNEFGDMIAFGRGYTVQIDGQKIETLDLYTDEAMYRYQKGQSGLALTLKQANVIGKIPVIYYSQPKPEWSDVQSAIDRFELSISKHGDTNDYFGAPIAKVKGTVKGYAEKGEEGKILELEEGAEIDYLTWNQSPDSIKLEQENLRSLIHDMSDTPDFSFTQMSRLGTFSGVALRLLFMAAHLKAASKEEIFGEGVQRRINYIREAVIKLNSSLESFRSISIKPLFRYYLPEDTGGDIENISTAISSGFISLQTAVERNPLVENASEEMDRIRMQKEEEAKSAQALNDQMNEE